ncbi:AraC family transcriptional regulator [Spongiimicrobium salis]|uniref:AraC family transcriptional regulator n=1 Tax=Spongiimicrobium salis TaxID=1667022 RepID=UPI00374D6DB0
MYQEIKPSREIGNTIDTFWTFSKNNSKERVKVLPDTCTDLIFDLKRNRAFLSGIMTQYQDRELMAESALIGVRFKIENFGALTKIPLHETKDLRLELSEVLPTQKRTSLNQLQDLGTITDKIAFLENFIATSYKENLQRQDQMVVSVAEKIRALKGIVHIGELAKSYPIGLRQLERRFKSYIGLTVKEFSNMVRFNNAKKSIANFSKSSLLEIAFDMGYFDHAHMTHEFLRISGENPSFFR